MLSLDALTVPERQAALEQGCAAWPPARPCSTSAASRSADSSALALMLAWQRRARMQASSWLKNLPPGASLTFIAVPANVDALARCTASTGCAAVAGADRTKSRWPTTLRRAPHQRFLL
jgi:phospholipid transport system transporter-binding protein